MDMGVDMDMETCMGRLAKKTTILFDPDEYDRLKSAAHRRGCSVGELIRATLREGKVISDPEDSIDAAKELAEMKLPAGNWEEMEQETIDGGLE